jgi:ergothioneine biosynthesis protein EgtB
LATPARRDDPHSRMVRAWERSDRIFGLLAGDALLSRPVPLRHPFIFYLGHLPAFAWTHLGKGALGREPLHAGFDVLFERGIDPPDDAPAAPDPAASWPTPAEVLVYRDSVRAELLDVLDRPELRAVASMVIEHELMHHETLLYMIQELPAALKSRPAWLPEQRTGEAPALARVGIPAGIARLGAARDGTFRWDNEEPELAVDVPAFAIDSLPVTNRALLGFVDAGGYRDQAMWTDAAWSWLQRRGVALPHFWRKGDGGLRVRGLFEDVAFDAAADWPAYVTQAEATAYACWSGARLPSEAEFHRAAFGTPEGELRRYPWGDAAPDAQHGNFGFRHWNPAPAGSHPEGRSAFGVHELVGNGWEWTRTPFEPLPGFTPLPAYPGYSADFFDGRHFVLLGGSWATDLRLLRRSFRNWFQPHYPYAFAKFRCAHDA